MDATDHIRILLVEDSPADAQLLVNVLSNEDALGVRYDIQAVTRLREAVDSLRDGGDTGPDVVLLDLDLPDSRGLDTLKSFLEQLPDVPIIVLTGHQDPELSLQSIVAGAQDFLVKGHIEGALLTRSIRYAIERHRLQAALVEERNVREREREAMRLEKLGHAGPASVTAGLYGVADLSEGARAKFQELVEQYLSILQWALDERVYKVEHPIADHLQDLAEALGFLRAGPRDVIRLHAEALKSIAPTVTKHKAQAMVEEGRIRVLELMGHLAAWYRSRAVGGLRPHPPAASLSERHEAVSTLGSLEAKGAAHLSQ